MSDPIEPTEEPTTHVASKLKFGKLKKAGPYLFWGAIIALPAMNLGAAVINYQTVKLAYETELLKTAAETAAEITAEV